MPYIFTCVLANLDFFLMLDALRPVQILLLCGVVTLGVCNSVHRGLRSLERGGTSPNRVGALCALRVIVWLTGLRLLVYLFLSLGQRGLLAPEAEVPFALIGELLGQVLSGEAPHRTAWEWGMPAVIVAGNLLLFRRHAARCEPGAKLPVRHKP
jgi:hypothetical protein